VTYLRRFALAISIAIVYVTVLWAAIRMHERNSVVTPPSIAPTPPASVSARAPFVLTPPPDFNFEKRDRQIDWCYAQHGVPAMTFTHDRSNVLCLKSAAVIELPKDQ
jgi:hypothetical protein